MKTACGLVCSLLATTLLACAAPQATETARGAWYELRTPRFVVWTDGDVARAHALVGELERFHQVVISETSAEEVEAAPPLRIFLVKDRSSFIALTHQVGLSGLFNATLWGNYAIVDASSLESTSTSPGGRAILFHEYTHYMLAVRGSRVPSWYNEGLAEYMSATQFRDDGSYTVGCPPQYRTAWGALLNWVPMERVMASDNLGADVDVKRAMTDTYVQSWYAVHYFNEDSARKRQLHEYLRLWAAGTNAADAVQQGLGMSYAKLDSLLQIHAREPNFHCLAIKPEKPIASPKIEQRTLAPSEAHYHIGALLLASFGPSASALDVLKQAEKIEPSSPLVLLALGRAHWLQAELAQGDPDAELGQAEHDLEQARAHGGDSADALALAGHVQRVRAGRASAANKPYSEALLAARKAYRAAIRADDSCAEAYVGLGLTYLIEDNGSQEALVALEAAAYLLPLDTDIAYALAKIHIARNDTLQAMPALEYVLRWSKNQLQRSGAQAALDALRADAVSATKPAEEAPAPPAPADAPAPAP